MIPRSDCFFFFLEKKANPFITNKTITLRCPNRIRTWAERDKKEKMETLLDKMKKARALHHNDVGLSKENSHFVKESLGVVLYSAFSLSPTKTGLSPNFTIICITRTNELIHLQNVVIFSTKTNRHIWASSNIKAYVKWAPKVTM